MKKILVLVFLIITLHSFAIDKVKIKNCGNYYYGEANSEIYQEAKDNALKTLTEQIVVNVKSSMLNKLKETNENVDESVESIIQTHSHATLKNLKEIKTNTSQGMNVFLYISKTDVKKVFEERKELVYNLFLNAKNNERSGNIGNALKLYYYGSILMNSLPDESIEFNAVNLSMKIPQRINYIMQNLKFNVVQNEIISPKEKNVTLDVSFNNKPVRFIQFKFWDGNNQVTVEGKDGIAIIPLIGSGVNIKKINLNIEYAFYQNRSEYKIVEELWNVVNRAKFDNDYSLKFNKPKDKNKNFKLTIENPKNLDYPENLQKEAIKYIQCLKNKKIDEFTNDPYLKKKIGCFFKFNKPKILKNNNKVTINKTFDGWELRRIPIVTEYNSIHKKTTEYITLDFDEKGDFYDLNFSIYDELYKQFVETSKYTGDWKKRQIIIKFVEKYRTAFMNRDMKTLNSIFSDDAVIIVGRILKKTPKRKDYQYAKIGNQPDIEYIKKTKKEYLKSQRSVFKSQSDIYLGFNNFQIMKKNKEPNVYGVSMRQHYNSTTYADEGHLFLLIDFKEEKPKIYVRSWQPNEWKSDQLIKMSNYKIH